MLRYTSPLPSILGLRLSQSHNPETMQKFGLRRNSSLQENCAWKILLNSSSGTSTNGVRNLVDLLFRLKTCCFGRCAYIGFCQEPLPKQSNLKATSVGP